MRDLVPAYFLTSLHTSPSTSLHCCHACSCCSPIYWNLSFLFAGTFSLYVSLFGAIPFQLKGLVFRRILPQLPLLKQLPWLPLPFILRPIQSSSQSSSSEVILFGCLLFFYCRLLPLLEPFMLEILSIGFTAVQPIPKTVPSTWSMTNICGNDE